MNRRRIIRWLIVSVVTMTAFESARLVLPCKPRCTFWLWNEAALPTLPDAPVLSPDGRRLATIFKGARPEPVHIHVWDCADGRLLTDLRHENNDLSGVAFSPDGRRLVAVGSTGVCVVWDVASGTTLSHAKLDGRQDGFWEPCVVFGPNGAPLVADLVLSEANLIFWNGATGQKLATREGGLIVFKDGSVVGIRSSRTHDLSLYDVAAGRRTANIPGEDVWPDGWWRDVDCVPGAGILASTRPSPQCLIVLNTTSGQERTIPIGDRIRDMPTLRLSPDGRLAAVGTCFRKVTQPVVPQAVLDWLPNGFGHKITHEDDYEVALYDTLNGKAMARLAGDWAMFSRDGSSLLVFSEQYCAERQGNSCQATVYDLPLRGPFTTSFVFALGCAAVAVLVTRRPGGPANAA